MNRPRVSSPLLRTAAGCLAALAMTASVRSTETLSWVSLPAIPDRLGFAGSYAGLSAGALLVGGGANFPDKMPWEGGLKVWYDRLFVLESGAAGWRDVAPLPKVAGYGASLSTPEGVLLIGGGDAKNNFTDVLRLRWDGKTVHFETLPALPVPLAMQCAALVGRTVYVAGGLEKPDAAKASGRSFKLDLDRTTDGWRELPPCPGPERFLATAGSDGESFYVFGGARLVPDAAGKPVRDWLRDAWRYSPAKGWTRLADLPRPAVAAPSPTALSQGRLLVVGGDDGTQTKVSPNEHRGFPRDILAYDPKADRWTTAGEVPFSLVTTTAVVADGRLIVPGGEKRPGVRSIEVWSAKLP